MDALNGVFSVEIAGNELWRILVLFGIILISFILGRIVKYILMKSEARLESEARPITAITLDAFARSAVFLFAAVGIPLGLHFLELNEKMTGIADVFTGIFLTAGIGYLLYYLVDVPRVWLLKMAGKTESKLDDQLVPIVTKSLRITVIILVLVQIAQILSDKPITSIIAGLGIGGLAVALAAQDTIKNVFGSFVLFIDKPFELGDRIVVDGQDGPVEEIGLRSTKIRTLEGHLVTVPNGELANKTIRNIGKRPYIRQLTNLTITYDTPPEKVDRALEIVKELLDNHEGMHEDFPPRISFNAFNSDSLNIQVIYWYHPPDYWSFMNFTERFNKEVFRRFGEEGIDFAFPTQTLHLAGDPARPLTIGLRREPGDSDI